KKREQGFTLEEATKILRATLEPPPPRMSPELAAARRWVPWLCAYMGARVNEITQARASDITNNNPKRIWVLRIDPDAGTVKTGDYRDVPIHPHVIEQGFLEYVKRRSGRPLFYDPSRGRGRDAANPYYRKVGEKLAKWVRDEVGISDKRVAPNHGWRH